MSSGKEFNVVAIPLNRKEIVEFLDPENSGEPGATVYIVSQRPSVETEKSWNETLINTPSVSTLLMRDDPHGQILATSTRRLIPNEYLKEDREYLTRNLGGWSPVYFGVIKADEQEWARDPVLKNASVLEEYGERIDWFGADEQQVAGRLTKEFGTSDVNQIAESISKLYDYRDEMEFNGAADKMTAYADALYRAVGSDNAENEMSGHIPFAILIDELMGQLVRIEQRRRSLIFENRKDKSAEIAGWQQQRAGQGHFKLILKGEYVMGRQRRSTIVIAPELGIVIKQPGPEPLHEAKLAAKTHRGQPENWPVLVGDKSLVTAAGRLRLIINEGLLVGLNRLFHHNIDCYSALGFFTEPHISGPTLQEYVIEQPARLTPQLYEFVLLHQLVCEEFGVENGDWHAANFIVRSTKKNPFMEGVPAMVHIDWGAARPLKEDEYTHEKRLSRRNQVRNIAFSFQRPEIAKQVEAIHDKITSDADRMKDLKKLAEKIVTEGTN